MVLAKPRYDPKEQQINFTGNLNRAENATLDMFFIIEEAKNSSKKFF